MKITILKDIKRPMFHMPFYCRNSQILYDSKSPIAKKSHCLFYQQGHNYGQVGDQCDYLSHDELLSLEREGFITITKR